MSVCSYFGVKISILHWKWGLWTENQEWSGLDFVLEGHESSYGKSLSCQNLFRNVRDDYVVISSASCFTALNINLGQHIISRWGDSTCLFN